MKMLEGRGRIRMVLSNIREIGVIGAIRQGIQREPTFEVTETVETSIESTEIEEKPAEQKPEESVVTPKVKKVRGL